MHYTKAFKNGNSQAVRIPADLAYPDTDMQLEIERIGDELRIRPARQRLSGLLDVFAMFPADFLDGGREEQDQAERDIL
jgi:antitoxin VapB